ncbi:MAG TPA: sulfatase, partial [Thermoanaerobaculia bacterium]|nr:sulfatase [Thermoanaerobaculia bacterium]
MDRRAFLLVAALALACNGEDKNLPPPHQGPIVLITIDALRADVIGAKLTPNLDKLASESAWAGRAVSPSSWTVPSMATLFTGLQPWSVQSWSSDRAVLREDLITLPEALKARGYRTAGFRSNHWLERAYGYAQGFDDFRYLAQGKRAENHLEKLGPGRELVWVHILQPHAPYVRRAPFEDRLTGAPPDLPQKVRPADLEPYYDPAVPLPPEQEKVFRAMYELNAAYADDLLGRMVAALRRSGQWERTLLVVTSDHGEEFGEMEQIAHGGNLGRQLVEVPLMIKLPAGFGRPLALQPGTKAATVRVRATLLEAAGWKPEKGTAPSFFQP